MEFSRKENYEYEGRPFFYYDFLLGVTEGANGVDFNIPYLIY